MKNTPAAILILGFVTVGTAFANECDPTNQTVSSIERRIVVLDLPLDFKAGNLGEAVNIRPPLVSRDARFFNRYPGAVCMEVTSGNGAVIAIVEVIPGTSVNLRTYDDGTLLIDRESNGYGKLSVDPDGRAIGMATVFFLFNPVVMDEAASALPSFFNQANVRRFAGVTIFNAANGETRATEHDFYDFFYAWNTP